MKNDMNAHQFHVSADEVYPICHQTLNPAILICWESLLCGKTKAFGSLARVFAMKWRAHALIASFVCSRVWNDHSPLLFRVFQASEGKGEASEERETRATGKGAKRKKVGPVLWARSTLVHVFTLAKWGSFTCTPALRPVPRLDGQVKMYPRCWFHINSCPWRLMSRSTSLSPRQKRSNTERMSPPFSIEMTRVWSSSFIQTRKFLSLLWKIPRASGQSRAMPAHVRRGETGLSNRKWSSINCCCSAAVIPFSG